MFYSIRALILTISLLFINVTINAQANLSFQGILKKSNGTAVEDGTYSITFKLYTEFTGGIEVWEETQNAVEVTSGIYSVILGTVTPLDAAFDVPYYLGVTVGSNEMVPRFRLTSAPYALSLQGQSNTFPSTGAVTADQIKIKSGNPGSPEINGYSFGNGGDEDGGLYSSSDGEVTLYVNGAKRMEMLADSSTIYGNVNVSGTQTIDGDLKADNVDLKPGGTIKYNGFNGWQLVDVDNFENDEEGWGTYIWGTPVGTGAQSGSIERLNSTLSPFVGWWIRGSGVASGNGYLLKKEFNLNNIPHSEVMVEFTYLFLGSWDAEFGFGGFATSLTTAGTHGWSENYGNNWNFNPIDDGTGTLNINDRSLSRKMSAENGDNTITIFFGAQVNENQANESWGISNVKVYVR